MLAHTSYERFLQRTLLYQMCNSEDMCAVKSNTNSELRIQSNDTVFQNYILVADGIEQPAAAEEG